MESLIELCDLISQNPAQFADKLTWLCNRCPQPEALLAGSPRVSHSQINAILAISRFLSKTLDRTDNRPKSLILTFFRSIPTSFHPSFWPQSFPNDSIASFFTDFLAYVSKSAELDPDFAVDVAGLDGEVVVAAIGNNAGENWESSAISRVFLIALTKNFVPILPEDGEKLITCLLDQFNLPVQVPSSPSERIGMNSGTSSSQSSPLSNNVNSHNSSYSAHNEISSMVNDLSQMSVSSSSASTTVVVNGSGVTWKSGLESWYINYENKLEELINQVKLLLMLSPLVLLLVVHCLSSNFPILMPFPERDSLHRAGGSPWGVALLLVFLFFMISYQSSFHERWFPLYTK